MPHHHLSAHPPPSNITIQPVTPVLLPQYRRLITSLLPIRYQEKYFVETVSNPTDASLAVCAIWRDPDRSASAAERGKLGIGSGRSRRTSNGTSGKAPRRSGEHNDETKNDNDNADDGPAGGEVVGGIQCRLEEIPPPPQSPPNTLPHSQTQQQQHHQQTYNIYISTLVTSPSHRSRGIATALLAHILHTVLTHPAYAAIRVTTASAHVWIANADALAWYLARGFSVEGPVCEGYYRRLRPSGARVVRRRVGVVDGVGWGGGQGGGGGIGGGGGDGVKVKAKMEEEGEGGGQRK